MLRDDSTVPYAILISFPFIFKIEATPLNNEAWEHDWIETEFTSGSLHLIIAFFEYLRRKACGLTRLGTNRGFHG